mgnify:CR=1 FL=1
MSLYKALQKAQTEEDVKATYIKALKLKEKKLGLIDIQTEKIWFEAKKAVLIFTPCLGNSLCM